MLIRLFTAICAASLLTACGQVDYGLEKSNHTIHNDEIHCRGDKYPKGHHPAHVDRDTLEVLKLKCDLQGGVGSYPIEVIISHDPNIHPVDDQDDKDDGAAVFCPTIWNYTVKIYDYPVGGNTRMIGECRTKHLGEPETTGK